MSVNWKARRAARQQATPPPQNQPPPIPDGMVKCAKCNHKRNTHHQSSNGGTYPCGAMVTMGTAGGRCPCKNFVHEHSRCTCVHFYKNHAQGEKVTYCLRTGCSCRAFTHAVPFR